MRILVTVTDRSGDRDRFAAVWRCAAIHPSKIPNVSANKSSHSAERLGVKYCMISISAPYASNPGSTIVKRCGKALQPRHVITPKTSRWFDLSQPVVIIGGGDGTRASTNTASAQAMKAHSQTENRIFMFQVCDPRSSRPKTVSSDLPRSRL